MICRPFASGTAGWACAPHFLVDQLTLSQPGWHIIPTQYYKPPPPEFSDLATTLLCIGPAMHYAKLMLKSVRNGCETMMYEFSELKSFYFGTR